MYSQTSKSWIWIGFLQVLTVTIQGMHNLPGPWMLREGDEGGDGHLYDYTASYAIPASQGDQNVLVDSGEMVPADLTSEPEEQEGETEEKDEEQDAGAEGEAAVAEGNEGGQAKAGNGKAANKVSIVNLQHTLTEVDSELESNAQRVIWNHTHTSFVSPDGIRR